MIVAVILRVSACTINDIFDRKLDAGVGECNDGFKFISDVIFIARTKGRPLPSGRISVFAATVYLLIQYFVGLAFFTATLQGIAYAFTLFLTVKNFISLSTRLYVAIVQLLPLYGNSRHLKSLSDLSLVSPSILL